MSVQEVRPIHSAYGTVETGETVHKYTYGIPAGQYTDLPDYYGVTEFSVTFNGDEPSLAFVLVEGTSQESVVSRWQRIAAAVANTEWWS